MVGATLVRAGRLLRRWAPRAESWPLLIQMRRAPATTQNTRVSLWRESFVSTFVSIWVLTGRQRVIVSTWSSDVVSSGILSYESTSDSHGREVFERRACGLTDSEFFFLCVARPARAAARRACRVRTQTHQSSRKASTRNRTARTALAHTAHRTCLWLASGA